MPKISDEANAALQLYTEAVRKKRYVQHRRTALRKLIAKREARVRELEAHLRSIAHASRKLLKPETKRMRARTAPSRRLDGRPYNWPLRVAAAALYLDGLRDAAIGQKVGRTRETVNDWRHHSSWPDAIAAAQEQPSSNESHSVGNGDSGE